MDLELLQLEQIKSRETTEEGGELLFLPSPVERRARAWGGVVFMIKRCLKINIRRIYLFCDEGRERTRRSLAGGRRWLGGFTVVSAEVPR